VHHKKLLLGEIICRGDLSVADRDIVSSWCSDPDVVSAVWILVDLCSSSCVENEASSVLADFISRVCLQFSSFVLPHYAFFGIMISKLIMQVGISDVHQVVLNLPTLTLKQPLQLHNGSTSKEDYGISDDILVGLLKLLKTYLSDEPVEIIDVTSQTLRVSY
jgi:hypothetical protein